MILFMRPNAITIALPLASGVAAPHMPVLPPCGTIGVRVPAHRRTTAATSSLLAGRTIAAARP